MERDIQEILIDANQLKAKVKELGQRITADYKGKNLLMVCVLKGGITFMADLIREINLPIEIDFMAVSSYGASTHSSGVVRILKDLETGIEGKHVLIVEDIIDTGLTLKYLVENLKARKAASVKICTLLEKPARRRIDINIDYCGFTIPDKFVVGYGLDYNEKYRNLPYIAVLKPEVYSS
ncbi:MAG TPA: hypoxanthine phosphoribosyltransferase [Clostridia bacterium]|nr:hypoxanthine phosphoribosyltransferase [Clostridia bacterium]